MKHRGSLTPILFIALGFVIATAPVWAARVNPISTFTGGSISNPLLLPAGTAAAPPLTFDSDPNTGLLHGVAADDIEISLGGTTAFRIFGGSLIAGSGGAFSFADAANPSNTSQDTYLSRHSAGRVKVTSNGTNLGGIQLETAYVNNFQNAGQGFVGVAMGGLTVASATAHIGGVAHVNTTAQPTTGTAGEALATYVLPGGALGTNGNAVRVKAWGTTAANAGTKLIELRFGATARTIVIAGTHNNFRWAGEMIVIRTGAATQDTMSQSAYNAASAVGSSYVEVGTAAETLSGDINIVVWGDTPTTAGDATFEGMIVEFLN